MKIVACVAVLAHPSGTVKNAFRCSRIVVLPDYQGMGIGSFMNDYVASLYRGSGYRYFIKTANPALGLYNEKSEDWRGTSKNKKKIPYTGKLKDELRWQPLNRLSYCHEYIGNGSDDYSIYGIDPV